MGLHLRGSLFRSKGIMTAKISEEKATQHFDRKLWLSLLGPPVIWLIYLQTAYVLVGVACSSGLKGLLHVGAGVFLGLTCIAGLISYGQWKTIGGGWPSENNDDTLERRRAMAMIGILQSALFAAIIVTSW